MPRRQSLLAQQLSGYKRPTAPYLSEVAEEGRSKEDVADYRRLSTLYGSNIKTVAMTKQRRKSRMLKSPEEGGREGLSVKRGGRASPAFSMGSAQSLKSVNSERGRLNSADGAVAQGRIGSVDGDISRGGTPGKTADGRPRTADETLRALKSLRKNKMQNMKEPLFDRLSRPKPARQKAKFVRGKKDHSYKTVEGVRELMKVDVHPDNEVGHPWFYGYNNSAKLPPSTPFAIASRFGYRGASELTKQCSDRAQYIDIDRPKDIVLERDLIRANEWGPAVHNEAAKTYNNPNTPKQWPEATEFPVGSKMKLDSTTHWYNRETTLGMTQRR